MQRPPGFCAPTCVVVAPLFVYVLIGSNGCHLFSLSPNSASFTCTNAPLPGATATSPAAAAVVTAMTCFVFFPFGIDFDLNYRQIMQRHGGRLVADGARSGTNY